MRVLVTGGLGVIGSHIASRYLDEGHEVSIIDSAEESRNRWIRDRLVENKSDKLHVHIARIEHSRLLTENAIEWADHVIHTAASTGIPYSVTAPHDDWERNVEATRVLLDSLKKRPRPTVVLSSVKPYRVDSPERMTKMGGLNEEVPLEPDEPYAASKAAQSMLCMAYGKSYHVPVVTLRCSNLYGPAPCHGPRHGWLTWFSISAAIGRPLVVQGTGDQARDMLYASDVATACQAALKNAPRLAGRVFNIGGGKHNIITVRQAAATLHGWSGTDVMSGPGRSNEDMLVFANYSRFESETGWKPAVSVQAGLERIYAWARAHRADMAELYRGAQ